MSLLATMSHAMIMRMSVLGALAGCAAPVKKTVPPPPASPTTVTASAPVPFPDGFEPPPALGPPLQADATSLGASYLEQVAPAFQEPWAQFLEDCRLRLEPGHALNRGELATTVGVEADREGRITSVYVIAGSGNPQFDQAALEVATDAGPLPAPSRAVLSDDDRLTLIWLFARDTRQAGPASAMIRRVQSPIALAMPKLLAEGELDEAARRLATLGSDAGRDDAVQAADQLMTLIVMRGLASPDLATQRTAIAAAARAGIADALPTLRVLAAEPTDPATRAAAIEALAAIGDREAIASIEPALDAEAPALVAAAARATVALGGTLDERAAAWLAAGRTEHARLVASHAPIAYMVPDGLRQVADGDPHARATACIVLGRAAAKDGAAWRGLRRGLQDRDADVRAACANAIAEAAAAGGRDRGSFWATVALLEDRAPIVRAAAVRATVYLAPERGAEQLYAVSRDRSVPVLASLAEVWGVVGASNKLSALLAHEDPAVRAAATRALVRGDEGARRRLAASAVLDAELRPLAIAASTDADTLARAVTDADPAVRVAAIARSIELRGRQETLREVGVALITSQPAERIDLAGAWLAERSRPVLTAGR